MTCTNCLDVALRSKGLRLEVQCRLHRTAEHFREMLPRSCHGVVELRLKELMSKLPIELKVLVVVILCDKLDLKDI